MNPLENIKVGMTAESSTIVTAEMTVGHVLPGMPLVYATPMMILLMEMAAGDAIGPHLPDGFASVGAAVNVRHLAATPVGHTVRAIAKVIEVSGRKVNFAVEAWDGDRKIGDGTHLRGVIDLAKFKDHLPR